MLLFLFSRLVIWKMIWKMIWSVGGVAFLPLTPPAFGQDLAPTLPTAPEVNDDDFVIEVDPPEETQAQALPDSAAQAPASGALEASEAQPVADPTRVDLGPETNLGPGSVNLQAMIRLDTTMASLRDLASEDSLTGALDPSISSSPGIDKPLPLPFACDLPALSGQLQRTLTQATPEQILAWGDLAEVRGIPALPRQSQDEQCAVQSALLDTLELILTPATPPCRPLASAHILAEVILDVPPNQQPDFARALTNLAQAQLDARLEGRPATDLCNQYTTLEAEMRAAAGL